MPTTTATELAQLGGVITVDSGNVGLGVTPSAWGTSEYKAIQVGVGGSISGRVSSGDQDKVNVAANVYNDGSVFRYIASEEATIYQQTNGIHIFSNAPSGTAGNTATFTERLRIDSSGNVGIGTTSPDDKLDVNGFAVLGTDVTTGQASTKFHKFKGTAVQSGASWYGSYGGLLLDADSSFTANARKFLITNSLTANKFAIIRSTTATTNPSLGDAGAITSGTADFVITNTGNVGIGTESPARLLTIDNATNPEIGIYTSGTERVKISTGGSAASQLVLDLGGTERLRITSGGEVYIAGTTDQGAYNLQVNGTGVWGAGAYVNGSDERLKENIQDLASGLDVIEKLRPVTFNYKSDFSTDTSTQAGFIAQDLLVALDGKNYIDGTVSQGPTYYNVAYQTIIPILTKAIQELKAENDSLKTRITALEAA